MRKLHTAISAATPTSAAIYHTCKYSTTRYKPSAFAPMLKTLSAMNGTSCRAESGLRSLNVQYFCKMKLTTIESVSAIVAERMYQMCAHSVSAYKRKIATAAEVAPETRNRSATEMRDREAGLAAKESRSARKP